MSTLRKAIIWRWSPNSGDDLGIVLGEAFNGLADDLEISLDSLPEQAISVVVVECLAAYRIAEEGGGVANVLKQLGRLWLHRRAVASCSPSR